LAAPAVSDGQHLAQRVPWLHLKTTNAEEKWKKWKNHQP